MKIKLKNKSISTVTTETFELTVDGKKITYIEYLNDKNKVIDMNLRDSKGNEITDDNNYGFDNVAGLLMEIQQFLNIKFPEGLCPTCISNIN